MHCGPGSWEKEKNIRVGLDGSQDTTYLIGGGLQVSDNLAASNETIQLLEVGGPEVLVALQSLHA